MTDYDASSTVPTSQLPMSRRVEMWIRYFKDFALIPLLVVWLDISLWKSGQLAVDTTWIGLVIVHLFAIGAWIMFLDERYHGP